MRPSGGRRRGVTVAAGIVGALLVAALVGARPPREGPPLDPRSDAPSGTSALVELLRRLDAVVDLSVGLPGADDDVALVLQDTLADDQRTDLLDWVRRGGSLVVASPGPLTPAPVRGSILDPPLAEVDRGDCTIRALDALGVVDTGGGTRFEVPAGSERCFADRDAAYVVATTTGAGTVVALGGPGFVTNELLAEADNAALAAALLVPGPGTRVRVVDPPVPAGGGDKTLLELVPEGVRRALLQLAVAFVLYAGWRAIRLGRPVSDDQPVTVAGSELVAAVGRLLGRTRAPGAAASLLRSDLRRAVSGRLGLPPDAPAAALADAASDRTGVDRATVLRALDDRPITTDDELVEVARAAATTRQEVLR